jgi:GntR family transcriptional regulator
MAVAQQISLNDLRASVDAGDASERPKYLRLVDAFSDCVVEGRFKPGQRVPTETDLAQALPVSVGTIQKALGKLASDGLIVRHRKSGTFIAERRSQVDEVFVYRFKDPETGKTMLPFVRTLAVEVDEAVGPWQNVLGGKKSVRIDRLVWFDQQPPAYSSVYFKLEHGLEFLDIPLEDLHGMSVHRRLIEQFNLPTIRMEHSIACRSLSDAACQQLMLPEQTIGLVWSITDYSIGNSPLLFQRYQLPPGHRPLEIIESFGH